MSVSLMKLKPWSRRYPLDDDVHGVSMQFCGELVDAGSLLRQPPEAMLRAAGPAAEAPSVVSAACREQRPVDA